jgi:large subunit ribosomal protein L19
VGGVPLLVPSGTNICTHPLTPAAYPFSSKARFPAPTAPSPIPANLLRPASGTSVVTHQNEALKKEYDTAGLLTTIFARRSRERIPTGSVMSVLSYADAAKTSVTPFAGVLMRVRRRGVDTSFTLRNVVQKTGIEMNFKVCSPLIKEIKIVRRAAGRKTGVPDLRRARVNYLRERPNIMSQIASALKQSQKPTRSP